MPATAEPDAIKTDEYDLVVPGSGEGSKFLSWTLAKQGQRGAMVERRWIGGTCLTRIVISGEAKPQSFYHGCTADSKEKS